MDKSLNEVVRAMIRGSPAPMIIILILAALLSIFGTIFFLFPLTSGIIVGDIIVAAVITGIIIGAASVVHRNFVHRKI